ncbi:MAG: tRNA pseudouridine(38-40) synthase TruA, partial [Nevskia sp.]
RSYAFLFLMVRMFVGSLMVVGIGRRTEAWIGVLLAGRDRTRAGMTAAAAGLYFVGPDYPAGFDLPAPSEPWFPG